MAWLVRLLTAYPPFPPLREGLLHNNDPCKNFPWPLHPRQTKIPMHSHCPCSHWKKATGPDTRMIVHERPWIIPAMWPLALGHLPTRKTLTSVPCFTFPRPGPSPSMIYAANIYPAGEEIIKLFRRGWKEKDNDLIWANTVGRGLCCSLTSWDLSDIFLTLRRRD